jgi:hypothetical protein
MRQPDGPVKHSVNLVLTVLQVVSPVFLIASAGTLWIRLGWEYPVAFVTRLAMTLAVPCLIFTSLAETEIAPAALTALSAAALLGYGALALVMVLAVTLLGLDRRTYAAPLTFGNTGNLGLPLALFAFGETGLDSAVVVFAVMAILQFTLGLWLVAGAANPLRVLKEPIVIATLAGGLVLWQGWALPEWLWNTLDLVGQMAIPLMLLTLGVAVGRLRPGRLGQAGALSLLRLGLSAATAILVGQLLGLERVAFAVLVLQMVTPVAVVNYLLAERHGADGEAVAGLVFVSTLLAVVTLPLALALLI